MRRILDRLYAICSALAAACLVAIWLVVLAQVACNVLNRLIAWTTGLSGDYVLPSYAEFAGFFLAAASFLALAGTFRAGAHIRVSLLLRRLRGLPRRLVELGCLAVAIALVTSLGIAMCRLTLDAWRYQDLSPGMVPLPLWLPQSCLCLGLAVFALALADAFVAVLRGAEQAHPPVQSAESGE